ncbi:YhcG family protein [Dyadobacter sp. Leaf189]|uniref:PDDEXK nuclease domain-containing protein n=1 Tax=Dyadobacter sp. Leaf189 TaxID=1736295 RepID=UPI0006FECDC8|nr:PDDEXK nuclease domain-containing protein [Dyadobacter sp. Leaf189]KQS24718.1 hypothetical protein ASG33_23475 [Dyadobacter sp. Leaf189]
MNENIFQKEFIADIKGKIRAAQYEALKVVNVKLINLYWEIGKSLSEKQAEGWGKSIVPTLSRELQLEFPGMKGFSTTNLWYMVQFYNDYQGDVNLQPLAGEISWTKHLAILSKCKSSQERQFYILSTRKNGWSRNVLINQIENKAYEHYLLNQTNFEKSLPTTHSNQALLAVKDNYTFAFLNLSAEHSEAELELTLITNIQNFLLEMGNSYTFVGSQYRIQVADRDYWIDLLLFHRELRCLVAIELKIGDFEPEYKGKMEFYLAVLNDTVKLPHENVSIGIIICKSKNRTIVEYSLRNSTLPIGVATYSTSSFLPPKYQNLLPSEQEIADKLQLLFKDQPNSFQY